MLFGDWSSVSVPGTATAAVPNTVASSGAAVRRAHQASQVPSASARQVGAAPHVPVAGPSAGTGVAQPGPTAPGLDELSATIVADALAEALQEEGAPPPGPHVKWVSQTSGSGHVPPSSLFCSLVVASGRNTA